MFYEVILLGAGPAGCAAATLLAAWGHRVLLVDRGARDRMAAESIPPSAQKLLATLGMLPAIEDAGFQPWLGNTVWWGDAAPRVESFASGASGYQVVRADFDRLLRELAGRSGVTLLTGLARQVSPVGEGATSVLVEREGGEVRAKATFVLDCSGRSGVIARHGHRVEEPRRTIALGGLWRASRGWAGTDDTHTLVASYADGWAWSIATAPGVRHFTVMVDPARTPLLKGTQARDVYRAELGKVPAFTRLLADATLADGPSGADASGYSAVRHAGADFLLVGDAASSIDPLSSFGVKKALASGWLAAIATHTALTEPAMRGEAFAFYERRERAVFAAAARRSAELASTAGGNAAHAFWSVRAEAHDGSDFDEPDAAALARDADVIAAFEDLRAGPSVALRPGPAFHVAPRPAVRGREIVLVEHVLLPGWPEGVRYLREVDLVALVRRAPDFSDVGDLCEAVLREQPHVALPDILGALSVLIARRALINPAAPT